MLYKSFGRSAYSRLEVVMKPGSVRVLLALMLVALLASSRQPTRVRAAEASLAAAILGGSVPFPDGALDA